MILSLFWLFLIVSDITISMDDLDKTTNLLRKFADAHALELPMDESALEPPMDESSLDPPLYDSDGTTNLLRFSADNHASAEFFSMMRKDGEIFVDMKDFEIFKLRIWNYVGEKWKRRNGRLLPRLKAKDYQMGLGLELWERAEQAKEGGSNFLDRLRFDKEFAPSDNDSNYMKDKKKRIIGIIDWAKNKYEIAEEDRRDREKREKEQLAAMTQHA